MVVLNLCYSDVVTLDTFINKCGLDSVMTLNVIVNNVVAVDREVSHGPGRTTDNFEKMSDFSREKCHGVVLGNGQALMLDRAISSVRRSSAQDVDALLADVQREHVAYWQEVYERQLRVLEGEMKAQYRLVADEGKRAEIIASKFADEVDRYHSHLRDGNKQGRGCLYVVAYDKEEKRVRKFHLPEEKDTTLTEFDLVRVMVDGSGGDLAGAYLTTHTSGVNWKRESVPRDFYFVSLACAAATANAGVGGFMDVVVLTPEEVAYLDQKRVNAAVRVCGKQIAGDISKEKAIELVTQLYEKRRFNFRSLARELDMTVSDLQYSPCRIHQDTARFNARNQI